MMSFSLSKESEKNMKTRTIGLALGSGAVRGYALIPIIKRLEKENLKISAISGSSVGALIGASYALKGEIDTFFEFTKNMSRKDNLKLIDPNNPKISLFKGKKIKKFLQKNFFGDKTFKDVKIPLYICATDFIGKKPVYLSKGKLIDSVMASVSIPGLVPPYQIGKKYFVDGGVLDPIPIKPLLEKGLEKVVGISLVGHKTGKKRKGDEGLIPALMNSFYMMMEQLGKKDADPRLFMFNLRFEPDPTRMLAFYDWEENYKIGEKAVEKKIKSLRTWLKA
jgi:NTE family protein